MRTPLHLLFCGVVVVGLTTAVALFLGVRREQGDLGVLVARLANRAEAEFSETVLLASVLSQHQSIINVASGSTETKTLDRLVIQTGLSAILVHDDQGQILAAGYRRPLGSAFAGLNTNNGGLSKRFIRDEGQSGMFVVSYPIKGTTERTFLTLSQSLEDQALYWRAISENVRLTGPDGETLYAHDRKFGWSPLVRSARAQIHGTELTLTRDPKVLGGYAALGFSIGVILVLASFL